MFLSLQDAEEEGRQNWTRFGGHSGPCEGERASPLTREEGWFERYAYDASGHPARGMAAFVASRRLLSYSNASDFLPVGTSRPAEPCTDYEAFPPILDEPRLRGDVESCEGECRGLA